MRIPTPIALGMITATLLIASCKNEDKEAGEEMKEPVIKTENVTYTLDTLTMNGYLAYDSAAEGKRPAVLVVHEWWGLNDYPKKRAEQLAALGYVAFAVDMYGNGKTVDNPTDAAAMSTPFYTSQDMAKQRFAAALAKVKTMDRVDTSKIAAIGYCFGGSIVLYNARIGEDLDGVVSFHGSLGVGPTDKNLLKSSILVCHGEADTFVPQAEIDQFKKGMDSIGADYTFKSYPDAVHAFTNPNATAIGQKFNIPIAYNAQADSASWNDMKEFFGRIFN